MQARDSGLSGTLRELTGEALRLVIERPDHWENRLYAQLLRERLLSLADLKRDRELDIVTGAHEHVGDLREVLRWVELHLTEMLRKVETVNPLFRKDVMENAFGAPGEPGIPDRIVYLADRLAGFYREGIEWSLRCRRVATDAEFQNILQIVARGVDNILQEIEQFSETVCHQLSELLNNPPAEGETRHIEVVLELTYPDELLQAQNEELTRLAEKLGVRFDAEREDDD